MLNITERAEGEVTVLDLQGNLALGSGEEVFREAIDRLLAEEKTSILLNLEAVAIIDSSGVGALVRCLTSVTRAGGKVKGLSPAPMVQKVLKITGVFELFEFFDDEEAGVSSF